MARHVQTCTRGCSKCFGLEQRSGKVMAVWHQPTFSRTTFEMQSANGSTTHRRVDMMRSMKSLATRFLGRRWCKRSGRSRRSPALCVIRNKENIDNTVPLWQWNKWNKMLVSATDHLLSTLDCIIVIIYNNTKHYVVHVLVREHWPSHADVKNVLIREHSTFRSPSFLLSDDFQYLVASIASPINLACVSQYVWEKLTPANFIWNFHWNDSKNRKCRILRSGYNRSIIVVKLRSLHISLNRRHNYTTQDELRGN